MKIKDGMQKEWQEWQDNNTDFYGRGVIEYAERWARKMEFAIEAGKTIPEVADRLSHDADTDGITGFMYGMAVNMLSRVWEHGEELRVWHNAEYGVGPEEKGTVNPAIIHVTLPEDD